MHQVCELLGSNQNWIAIQANESENEMNSNLLAQLCRFDSHHRRTSYASDIYAIGDYCERGFDVCKSAVRVPFDPERVCIKYYTPGYLSWVENFKYLHFMRAWHPKVESE